MASEVADKQVDKGTEGSRALSFIDAAIAERPHKDDYKLAAAVENICAWRRDMIGKREAGTWDDVAERKLGTLNGVLSLVLAVHFPLGPVRWHELEGARTALAGLVERP